MINDVSSRHSEVDEKDPGRHAAALLPLGDKMQGSAAGATCRQQWPDEQLKAKLYTRRNALAQLSAGESP